METARFQIVSGVRVGDRLRPNWPVHPDGVPAAPAHTVDGTREVAWFGWRLLSRNHRDLARSPTVFPSADGCADAVRRIRGLLPAASATLVRNPRTGRWTWLLETADGVVATSSRGYLRRRECHDCIAQVVALAPVAIAPEPDEPLVAHPRHRG